MTLENLPYASKTLTSLLQVHLNITMIENPKDGDPKDAPPIAVQSCFDRLEITVNNLLLATMGLHLQCQEHDSNFQGDS
jgi:hypothetical protein